MTGPDEMYPHRVTVEVFGHANQKNAVILADIFPHNKVTVSHQYIGKIPSSLTNQKPIIIQFLPQPSQKKRLQFNFQLIALSRQQIASNIGKRCNNSGAWPLPTQQ